MEKMTISQYATFVGKKKDTIHKRIKRGEKLSGVKKMEKSVGSYNPTLILFVNKKLVKK